MSGLQSAHRAFIAFDLYGTLLSTESIARELGKVVGDHDQAKSIAASWRRYQLEYTWRLNSMGIYKPFDAVTRAALNHALGEAGLKSAVSGHQVDGLMEAYNRLELFPDASKALDLVAKLTKDKSASAQSNFESCIFSNGTEAMVRASMESPSSASQFRDAGLLSGIVTVEKDAVFKPARRTYDTLRGYVRERTRGRNSQDIWVLSANPFDVVGARAAGLRAAWIDRAGTGWVDSLADLVDVEKNDDQQNEGVSGLGPNIIARCVDEAVERILKLKSA